MTEPTLNQEAAYWDRQQIATDRMALANALKEIIGGYDWCAANGQNATMASVLSEAIEDARIALRSPPVTAGVYPCQAIFDSIAAATEISEGAIRISVKAFFDCLSNHRDRSLAPPVNADGAGLREALEPFAEALQALDDGIAPELKCDDDMCIGNALWESEQPTVGDLRKLIASLRATAQQGGETFDPTNHHNALKCQYCNPQGLTFATPAPAGAVREALEKLLMTAKLLQQNSEGCAVNHHGLDFEQQGLPGWLRDTQKSIDVAAAALALPASARVEETIRKDAIEAVISFIEGGRFLHDDAPPKRFAAEVVAGIRRSFAYALSRPDGGGAAE